MKKSFKSQVFEKLPFTNFSEQDWACYAGAEGDPLIAITEEWEIIVDDSCVSLHHPNYNQQTDELTANEFHYDYKAKNVNPWEVVWVLLQMPVWFVESQLFIMGFEKI